MTEKKRRIIDNGKLTLSAKPQGGRPPQLKVDTYNQNPQFDVWTGSPADPVKGPIKANMDAPTFFQCLNTLKEVAAHNGPIEYMCENKHTKKDGQQGSQPVTVSFTKIGKDDKGGVYLAVESTDERRPRIRFYFGYNRFHSWTINGNQDRAKGSADAANAWADTILALYPASLVSECTDGLPAVANSFTNNSGGGAQGGNKPAYNNGGGNKGGYNNNGGNGGGYNNGGNQRSNNNYNQGNGGYSGGSDTDGDDDDGLPF